MTLPAGPLMSMAAPWCVSSGQMHAPAALASDFQDDWQPRDGARGKRVTGDLPSVSEFGGLQPRALSREETGAGGEATEACPEEDVAVLQTRMLSRPIPGEQSAQSVQE